MRKRATRRLRRSLRQKTQKGRALQRGGMNRENPTVLGRGMEGTVYERGNTVEKVTKPATAAKEERAAAILRLVDPRNRFTIYGTEFRKDGGGVKIIQPHGGEAIAKFTDAIWLIKRTKKEEEAEKYEKYVKTIKAFRPHFETITNGFKTLAEFLPSMHESGITHSDMQPSNLVWDGERLRLIDWGQSTFRDGKRFQSEKDADIEGLGGVLEEWAAGVEYANEHFK